MGRRVAVVGAGYAGMAAAVTLAERGAQVSVFESGPLPGGRARRVTIQGQTLDNGQHILVGAYATLFSLMRTVGVPADAVLRIPLELRYADGFKFRAYYFPAPLGLLAGLLLAHSLPWRERIGAVRFMLAMRRQAFRLAEDCSVSALLARHVQHGRIGHYLWKPLCISALNTPPEFASANVFLTVLRDTLASDAEASDLILPRVDLSRLFPEPATQWLRSKGAQVRFETTVRDLAPLKSAYDAVILAVGPHHEASTLPRMRRDTTHLSPIPVELEPAALALLLALDHHAFAIDGDTFKIARVPPNAPKRPPYRRQLQAREGQHRPRPNGKKSQ